MIVFKGGLGLLRSYWIRGTPANCDVRIQLKILTVEKKNMKTRKTDESFEDVTTETELFWTNPLCAHFHIVLQFKTEQGSIIWWRCQMQGQTHCTSSGLSVLVHLWVESWVMVSRCLVQGGTDDRMSSIAAVRVRIPGWIKRRSAKNGV